MFEIIADIAAEIGEFFVEKLICCLRRGRNQGKTE